MHDTDRLLQQLIDHPPHDPPSASDPAFTAAVFGRIRASPAPRRSTTQLLAWSLAGAALVSAALLLGLSPTDEILSLAAPADPTALATLAEILVAGMVMGIGLLAARRSLA
jgi:hypothetical protein